MQQPTLAERWRYSFDNYMARGTIALIGGLALASAAVIFVVAVIVVILNIRPGNEGERLNFIEAFWLGLMRTLDSGTMGGDEGWGFRLMMLVVTLGGIFVISTLIGVLTSGIESRLDELRKGRSKVIEKGHTVILGWSPQVFPIISELVLANANLRNSCVVILGPTDKVEMEDAIRSHVEETGKTRIVCRSGDPSDLADLALVSLSTCKSIIVLAPEGDNPDSSVIKTILAITNAPNRREEPFHIVAEIQEESNRDVAKMVGKDEVELLLVSDLIARIMAQTCRQSGLSIVYTELLDFEGDEIYFQQEQGLVGKTFGDALLAYENSTVIGLHTAAGPKLNPPVDTRIGTTDEIIVISEDDDTIKLSNRAGSIDEAAIVTAQPHPTRPERTLILGWNQRGCRIIAELDNYVDQGSLLDIVADYEADADYEHQRASLRNIQANYRQADTTDRTVLDELGIETYDHIILLCYSDHLEPQQADSRTLVTLLHLRDIADKLGHDASIVSEMLDVRNRELAEVTRADDFIVSDRLVSLMLSAVSENKQLAGVFADIFDADGSEPYLKPAEDYVRLGTPVDFYTIVASASRRGEVAFGYRIAKESTDASKMYGIHINPRKGDKVTFVAGDRVVVLAEE